MRKMDASCFGVFWPIPILNDGENEKKKKKKKETVEKKDVVEKKDTVEKKEEISSLTTASSTGSVAEQSSISEKVSKRPSSRTGSSKVNHCPPTHSSSSSEVPSHGP